MPAGRRRTVSIYALSILVSLTAHLVLAATIEAAVWLGNVLDWRDSGPRVTMIFHSRDAVEKKGTSAALHPSPSPFPLIRSAGLNLRYEAPRERIDDSYVSNNQFRSTVQQFQALQSEIDRRIDHLQVKLAQWFERALASKGGHSDYLSRMRERIAAAWSRYIPLLQGESGTVTVEYRILADGRISDLQTVSETGSSRFSRSCVQAVERASPFEPLPAGLSAGAVEGFLTVRLTFRLKAPAARELETDEVRRLIKIRLVRP